MRFYFFSRETVIEGVETQKNTDTDYSWLLLGQIVMFKCIWSPSTSCSSVWNSTRTGKENFKLKRTRLKRIIQTHTHPHYQLDDSKLNSRKFAGADNKNHHKRVFICSNGNDEFHECLSGVVSLGRRSPANKEFRFR